MDHVERALLPAKPRSQERGFFVPLTRVVILSEAVLQAERRISVLSAVERKPIDFAAKESSANRAKQPPTCGHSDARAQRDRRNLLYAGVGHPRQRCHPERSRSSGGAKHLSLTSCQASAAARTKNEAPPRGGAFYCYP